MRCITTRAARSSWRATATIAASTTLCSSSWRRAPWPQAASSSSRSRTGAVARQALAAAMASGSRAMARHSRSRRWDRTCVSEGMPHGAGGGSPRPSPARPTAGPDGRRCSGGERSPPLTGAAPRLTAPGHGLVGRRSVVSTFPFRLAHDTHGGMAPAPVPTLELAGPVRRPDPGRAPLARRSGGRARRRDRARPGRRPGGRRPAGHAARHDRAGRCRPRQPARPRPPVAAAADRDRSWWPRATPGPAAGGAVALAPGRHVVGRSPQAPRCCVDDPLLEAHHGVARRPRPTAR